jgi:hypothetical protein
VPHSNRLPRHDVGWQTQRRRVRHKSRLLGVADPRAAGVEINSGIMLHEWEVVVAAAQRDHKLTSDGHLTRSEDPHSGTCRHDQLVLLPNRQMRGKSMSQAL